jgi:hypothetical protein
MRPSIGWSVGIFFLVVVWETSVLALTAVQRTFDELVVLSECVLIGTVTTVKSELGSDGEKIYTYVTLSDLEVIKGEVSDIQYVLRVRGGNVDTKWEFYPGVPRLAVGGRYILFIQGNFHDFFPVVGLAQGIFRVEWDPERQREVVRNLQDQTYAQTGGGQPPEHQQESSLSATDVTVEAFVQRIHEQLRRHSQEGLHSTSHVWPGGSPSSAGATP